MRLCIVLEEVFPFPYLYVPKCSIAGPVRTLGSSPKSARISRSMNQPFDRPEQEITEPTRRAIFDELTLHQMAPNGRLDEEAFFQRVFNLTELPTHDYRTEQFPNMAADLWQHRVRNHDWGDDWWVTDDRLDLLHAPDETFLRFLAEMVHPVVRPDAADRETYLEIFNRHLAAELWEIGVVNQVGAHPIYGSRRLGADAAGRD